MGFYRFPLVRTGILRFRLCGKFRANAEFFLFCSRLRQGKSICLVKEDIHIPRRLKQK